MAQNGTKWRPSAEQAAVLEAACRPKVGRTITGICADAGVPRRTFYNWMAGDPGFRAAWGSVWQVALDLHFPRITGSIIALAVKGDPRMARLAAKMKGALIDRVELSGAVDLSPQQALLEKLRKLEETAKLRAAGGLKPEALAPPELAEEPDEALGDEDEDDEDEKEDGG